MKGGEDVEREGVRWGGGGGGAEGVGWARQLNFAFV